MTRWGYATSQAVAGILIYSSVCVYVMLVQQGSPFELELMLPPISGLFTAILLVIYPGRIRRLFS